MSGLSKDIYKAKLKKYTVVTKIIYLNDFTKTFHFLNMDRKSGSQKTGDNNMLLE